MSKSKAWLSAIRLRTLPLSLSGIILGTGVASSQGYWDMTIFILAISTTVLFQILSNLANDLGDGSKGTDNASRQGPTRAIQSGLISVKEMKTAVIIVALLSLFSATSLIYFGAQGMGVGMIWFYAGLALLCILAAISYTVGKRAYGYYGLGDLMVFIFFGGVSVLGVYSLYTKTFEAENILLAIFVGLMSTAVLNLNNMRDFKNDSASGKNTLVVKMGPNNAKFYHTMVIVLALLSLLIFVNKLNNPDYFIFILPAAILLFHMRTVMKTKFSKDFDPQLKIVVLSTFAVSVCLALGMIYMK